MRHLNRIVVLVAAVLLLTLVPGVFFLALFLPRHDRQQFQGTWAAEGVELIVNDDEMTLLRVLPDGTKQIMSLRFHLRRGLLSKQIKLLDRTYPTGGTRSGAYEVDEDRLTLSLEEIRTIGTALDGLDTLKLRRVPRSCNMLPLASLAAPFQSASTFHTHSRVALLIKDRSLRHDLGVERFAFLKPPAQVFWGPDDQIHGKGRRQLPRYFYSLIQLIACRHDDQQVHIAIGVRCSIRLGAEQDDLVRLKALGDLAGIAADDTHGNVGTPIDAPRPANVR